jgi:hypothetical protein
MSPQGVRYGIGKLSTRATTLVKARLNPSLGRGAMSVQSPGTPTWESREKEPFGCSLGGELQSILYGGRWWLPPSPGRDESCV